MPCVKLAYAGYVSVRVEKGFKRARFPETLCGRFSRVASTLTWQYLHWFHAPSSAIMVASPDVKKQLRKRGFRRTAHWSRGVDTDQFQSYGKNLPAYEKLQRPILVYMGRVAAEKNIEAFLSLDIEGSKVVVGDGPALKDLRARFPNVLYAGAKRGEELGRYVAASDLFVFPSKTDTFGLVLPEALACGVPVVAIPEGGPKDILSPEVCQTFSRLDENLEKGVHEMLALIKTGQVNTAAARQYVCERYSWKASAEQFYQNLQADTPKARRKTRRLGRILTAFRPWRLLL